MYTIDAPSTLDQGVVLRDVYFYADDEKLFGLVLTPRCDIEQSKADFVQLCALYPMYQFIQAMLNSTWSKLNDPTKVADLRGQIRNLAKQRIPRYHWFDPLPGTQVPLIADFQHIASLLLHDLGDIELVAELASPFREQVPTRYAAYMGRVGVPDSPEADRERWVEVVITSIFPSTAR